MSKGLFISFEGIDFSGKSVQVGKLEHKLKKVGRPVTLVRDPGTTRISEQIRTILLNTEHVEMSPWAELLLYEAARAQMVKETIRPALDQNKTVLCDRFYDSTTAYQGFGRGLDLELVHSANRMGSEGLAPDLTFIIDLDPLVAEKRMAQSNLKKDRLEAAGKDFYTKVAQGYRKIAQDNPGRIVLLNGERSIEEIHTEVWEVVQNKYSDLLT